MNCWELIKCDTNIKEICPAFTTDRGIDCWKVTGTKCGGGKIEMLSIQEKIIHCRDCDFYKNYANKF